MTFTPGQRIAVVGPSGCGKTTVAKAIADRLGHRYVCNDAIILGPNWTNPPKDECVRRFAEAFAAPPWVIDGNCQSQGVDDTFIRSQIDTLVWLNLPRRVVIPQLLRRTIRRAWTQEELWHGNRESFRLSFASRHSILWWSIKTHRKIHAAYAAMFNDPGHNHLVRIRLDSRAHIAAWLASLSR